MYCTLRCIRNSCFGIMSQLPKKKKSQVWEYFVQKSKDLAVCRLCPAVITMQGGSTSGLLRHLRQLHNLLTVSSPAPVTKVPKTGKYIFTFTLCFILGHELDFFSITMCFFSPAPEAGNYFDNFHLILRIENIDTFM